MTQFFQGKELPLTKKVFDQLANWVDKQRAKMAMNMTPAEANENTEEGNEGEGIKTARSVIGRFCNPYAIRGCLEALWFSYGHSVTPELPTHALYQQVWSQDINPATVTVPKLMFTVFNGGKALNSKVKFARFYVIMNVKVQDVEIDANVMHHKVAAAIKKAITSHKLGEAGFKANVSGSYFNALDSVNDSFKMIEDAINSTGFNTNERKYLTIGINADGHNSFVEESNRYDIEGPKNLFD